MATRWIPIASPTSHALGEVAASRPGGRSSVVRAVGAYVELTKPGITRLVTLTAGVGFYVGSATPLDWRRLIFTLIGVGLAAAGANALNQWWERERDARMRRTQRRPLPSGRVMPGAALAFGSALVLVGVVSLLGSVGVATAALVMASAVSYVLIYTPLKTRTPLCTLVGAVPGALPILAGWAASGQSLGRPGWSLFCLLFLWQVPHFLALAWLYREDYARAGYRMLSLVDGADAVVGRQILLYSAALLPVSLLPTMLGLAGASYLFGALALGAVFLGLGSMMAHHPTPERARRLFLASVIYLPLILGLMVVDKV